MIRSCVEKSNIWEEKRAIDNLIIIFYLWRSKPFMVRFTFDNLSILKFSNLQLYLHSSQGKQSTMTALIRIWFALAYFRPASFKISARNLQRLTAHTHAVKDRTGVFFPRCSFTTQDVVTFCDFKFWSCACECETRRSVSCETEISSRKLCNGFELEIYLSFWVPTTLFWCTLSQGKCVLLKLLALA